MAQIDDVATGKAVVPKSGKILLKAKAKIVISDAFYSQSITCND